MTAILKWVVLSFLVAGLGVCNSYAGESPYRIYAGVGGGFGSVLGGSDYESAPDGGQLIGGISLGHRTRRFEWDTGLSLTSSTRSGRDAQGRELSIQIRAARADVSVRYRLGSLELGPILAASFGTDTRFDPRLGSSTATLYGGAKAALDLKPLGRLPIQLWAELLTDVSSPGRDAFSSLIGVRLGIPFSFERHSDQIAISDAAPEREIRLALDPKSIFFDTGSARVNPTAAEVIREAGQFLSESAGSYEMIELDGHADPRGSRQRNLALSRKRAQAVREILLGSGLAADSIRIQALGASKSAKESWARARRVELIFRGVKDPAGLLRRLAPLNSQKRGSA